MTRWMTIGSLVAALAMAMVGCGGSTNPAPDAAAQNDFIVAPDFSTLPDLSKPDLTLALPDLAVAVDLSVPDLTQATPDLTQAPDGGWAQIGDPCGPSAAGLACAPGLACCYPCGIPGCSNRCQTPCPAGSPGCFNGCPLVP